MLFFFCLFVRDWIFVCVCVCCVFHENRYIVAIRKNVCIIESEWERKGEKYSSDKSSYREFQVCCNGLAIWHRNAAQTVSGKVDRCEWNKRKSRKTKNHTHESMGKRCTHTSDIYMCVCARARVCEIIILILIIKKSKRHIMQFAHSTHTLYSIGYGYFPLCGSAAVYKAWNVYSECARIKCGHTHSHTPVYSLISSSHFFLCALLETLVILERREKLSSSGKNEIYDSILTMCLYLPLVRSYARSICHAPIRTRSLSVSHSLSCESHRNASHCHCSIYYFLVV